MIKEVEEKVLIALDEIRPFLEKDGGDISLESISDNKIVNVKLHGSCVDCKLNKTGESWITAALKVIYIFYLILNKKYTYF